MVIIGGVREGEETGREKEEEGQGGVVEHLVGGEI
jgi:hypothetical protein